MMTTTLFTAARRVAFLFCAVALLSACDTGNGGDDDDDGSAMGQPTADAGAPQAVQTGQLVTLDGSGSTDPDGDALTYSWVFSSTPSGSSVGLSTSGTTATFTPDLAGSYTAQLTVSDGTLSDTDNVTVTATAPAFVIIDGDIGSDRTLTAGVYRVPVNERVTISNGVALTLRPGVRIEFSSGSELIVNAGAALIAEGTATQPILFVGQTPDAGLWNGIGFRSNDPRNVLDFVTVAHAGGDALFFMSGPSSVGIDNDARTAITNSTIRDSGTNGVVLDQGARLTAFSNNVMTDNAGYPATSAFDDAVSFDGTSTYVGNTNDAVNISGNADITVDATLSALDVPYRMTGRQEVSAGLLTIEAGTRLEFASAAELLVVSTGALRAAGTVEEPISFIGEAAVAGLWNGIGFRTNDPRNELDFVTVAYGGGDSFFFTSEPGNVGVDNGARVTVTNSTIRDSDGWGIWGDNGSTFTQSGNTFSNNVLGDFNTPALP